jgi:hypothetical protein
MKKALAICVSLAISCSNGKPSQNFSDKFEPGVKLGELKDKNLKEVSGLAASISNPRLLWAHNDHGNKPEIFLVDENLDVKLTCTLAGVENRDWEDITTGPGPDPSKNYIYVGDIGDNNGDYKHKFIYRFEEPKWSPGQSNAITVSSIDKIAFQLSDEQKDTEALLLDPKSKNLYVVSKRESPVHLYELKYPYNTTGTLTAEKVMSIPVSIIVAADFSAKGDAILMKDYSHVYYWSIPPSTSVTEALQKPPIEIAYVKEPQGESIAWAKDGSGFYTLSESVKKEKIYLYFYKAK